MKMMCLNLVKELMNLINSFESNNLVITLDGEISLIIGQRIKNFELIRCLF
jgi:hypothetical protein